jgi:hypothetical protein
MTPSLSPVIALVTALAAWCLAMVLTAAVRDAVAWDDLGRLLAALASALDVGLDRIVHGDPDGALRAFAALLRG